MPVEEGMEQRDARWPKLPNPQVDRLFQTLGDPAGAKSGLLSPDVDIVYASRGGHGAVRLVAGALLSKAATRSEKSVASMLYATPTAVSYTPS